MRRFLRVFPAALAFILFAAGASFAQSPDPKEQAASLEPGVYYWTGTDWQPMEPVTWSAGGVRKAGKSSVFSYRHPEARVQIDGASPLFCYKVIEAAPANASASPSASLMIARLDRKKDHRELATSSNAGPFAFQAGASHEHAAQVTATGIAPGVTLISPKEPLPPGEYVMGGSSLAVTGYDFGVHSAH